MVAEVYAQKESTINGKRMSDFGDQVVFVYNFPWHPSRPWLS